jgi:CheY-like chemotaxis protein
LIMIKEELPIIADRGQIEQVLMNLITNARDAIQDDGRIVIETNSLEIDHEFIKVNGFGQAGLYAMLSVSDTGAGIPEDVRNQIFDPFFTTKEEGKGTGLGLSMVFGIVKKHQGYIHVYSQQGMGTTFRIYLPFAQISAQQEAEKIEDTAPLRGGTETILIAEDDDALRNMAVTSLTQYGYTVIEAVDGMDAVTRFAENRDRIRLAIIDGIMPKKSGKEVCEEIQALNPGIKVIFISGYSEESFSEAGIPKKVDAFIQKPISPSVLVRSIRKMLEE